MKGKRPVYLLVTALVLLNLVATNLQANEVKSVFQAHLEHGTPLAYQFPSSH